MFSTECVSSLYIIHNYLKFLPYSRGDVEKYSVHLKASECTFKQYNIERIQGIGQRKYELGT